MRLINTVLIALLAFFALLAVFWGMTGRRDVEPPRVEGIQASWAPGGRAIDLDLTVRNHGPWAASASTATYKATASGQPLAGGQAPLALSIPAESAGTGRLRIALPDGFPSSWWTRYTASQEAGQLRIEGTVQVQEPHGTRQAAFLWLSTWTGHLASSLGSAPPSCDEAVCVRLEGKWETDRLAATLHLRNEGTAAVEVANGTVRLRLGGTPFAQGSVPRPLTLQPGAQARVAVALRAGPDAAASWWPGHAARCESSPVAVDVQLAASALRANATGNLTRVALPLEARLEPPAFTTRFLCQARP